MMSVGLVMAQQAGPVDSAPNGRFRNLAVQYRRARERLEQESQQAIDLVGMASWALHTSASGWALVRGQVICATNPAFTAFDSPSAGPRRWRRMDGDGRWPTAPSVPFSSLRQIVGDEARRLARQRKRSQARLHCSRGDQIVEVTLERAQLFGWKTAVLAVVRDVTDLVRAAREVRAAELSLVQQERLRTAGELAIGVAHDVNNVLAALALRVQPLLRDPECRQAQGRNVEAIGRIIDEGQRLVGRFQDLGRAQPARLLAVDLRETVNSAVEIAQSGLRLRAAERGVQIHMRAELPPLPRVVGLPEEVRHVLVNLLINARDAMPKGGAVTVRARTTPREVVLIVEDEGEGIPPAHLPRIFDAFFTTKGAAGTGMGLAMAQSVMKRIGGSISARNRATCGARFELRFVRWRSVPLAPADGARAEPPIHGTA